MAGRKMTSIEEVPLVGARLCLDFVNTTGARTSETPRERLHTYGDLLIWARRVGLLGEEEASQLAEEAEEREHHAEAALGRALRMRGTLYEVLRPLAEGERPDGQALTALDEMFAAVADLRTLGVGPDGVAWRWRRKPEELVWFLGPVVHSAERLLTFEEAPDLKRCGECDWLFVDETRNHSRRWCKKLCGDRVRSRRYYRRQKEGR